MPVAALNDAVNTDSRKAQRPENVHSENSYNQFQKVGFVSKFLEMLLGILILLDDVINSGKSIKTKKNIPLRKNEKGCSGTRREWSCGYSRNRVVRSS